MVAYYFMKKAYKMFTDIMISLIVKMQSFKSVSRTNILRKIKIKSITNDMQQYNFKYQTIVEAEIFCGRRLMQRQNCNEQDSSSKF